MFRATTYLAAKSRSEDNRSPSANSPASIAIRRACEPASPVAGIRVSLSRPDLPTARTIALLEVDHDDERVIVLPATDMLALARVLLDLYGQQR